ncbi:DegT/DnrJ/EryC1/StrS family aminotransferase [Amphritea balenae]|uniref:DegT/DnrJ/EryC1/StrS family aminotransferase n=1 Tax=Amphritea balenae TaxID=452629 RepID=A0A3P1SPJ8_9GAMM|nr:DegT/DnrJ/EryC1/StrS family aminotransferase [Amphritea balenae]RRC99191.1 DegT/DnrJ/EryC1/StrS family aminotransferase [Amphritea balenae]GGK73199.1 aminotransferase DegT [Amphritea balenae]
MIPVTKPYLPDREKLNKYIDGIYERQWFTNNGQLVQELTRRLEEYLGVENLLLVANGTLALQIAYRVLGVSGIESDLKPEAVTTPFTFVATASSLKWDGVVPVFTDIDPDTWCLDPKNIEAAITPNTRAIVPVHVFGNACDIDAINAIAHKHDLKVIYDASHAFGVEYKGESLLNYGDAATLSFHATKLFHTAEGGAIAFKRKEDLECAKKMINFGITGPESIELLGINAKMNELQAAVGLCVLDDIYDLDKQRSRVWQKYLSELTGLVDFQIWNPDCNENYAYAPLLFEKESKLIDVEMALKEKNITSRRYFYPSLDMLKYLGDNQCCKVSRDISRRILCVPIYADLEENIQSKITDIIK